MAQQVVHHGYLGQERAIPREEANQCYLANEEIMSIQLLAFPNINLFPGESIPLRALPGFARIQVLIDENVDVFGVLLLKYVRNNPMIVSISIIDAAYPPNRNNCPNPSTFLGFRVYFDRG